jgi:Carboxypeptidase regulatory-like domain/TonB-dependent Receptor Plug Domain
MLGQTIRVGDAVVDCPDALLWVGGRSVRVTLREFRILECLIRTTPTMRLGAAPALRRCHRPPQQSAAAVARHGTHRCVNKMTRAVLLALGALHGMAVTPTGAGGQVARVGHVINAATGSPISGADVTYGALRTTSDSTGTFWIHMTPPAVVVLSVRKLGFQPVELGRRVVAGDTATLFIVMSPLAVSLNPVHTVADSLVPLEYRFTHRYDDFFLHRTESIGGHFFTREQMDAHGGVGEAIATLPGVRVAVGGGGHFTVQLARCPRSSKLAVVVNGRLSSMEELNMIPMTDIELMEVYTGVADMPAMTRGNACGALVVYTK